MSDAAGSQTSGDAGSPALDSTTKEVASVEATAAFLAVWKCLGLHRTTSSDFAEPSTTVSAVNVGALLKAFKAGVRPKSLLGKLLPQLTVKNLLGGLTRLSQSEFATVELVNLADDFGSVIRNARVKMDPTTTTLTQHQFLMTRVMVGTALEWVFEAARPTASEQTALSNTTLPGWDALPNELRGMPIGLVISTAGDTSMQAKKKRVAAFAAALQCRDASKDSDTGCACVHAFGDAEKEDDADDDPCVHELCETTRGSFVTPTSTNPPWFHPAITAKQHDHAFPRTPTKRPAPTQLTPTSMGLLTASRQLTKEQRVQATRLFEAVASTPQLTAATIGLVPPVEAMASLASMGACSKEMYQLLMLVPTPQQVLKRHCASGAHVILLTASSALISEADGDSATATLSLAAYIEQAHDMAAVESAKMAAALVAHHVRTPTDLVTVIRTTGTKMPYEVLSDRLGVDYVSAVKFCNAFFASDEAS
eukprot:m.249651 g.249651  ORF g.249651 m.249651 type:complete len:480 (+) comp26486_c0_seq1:113-1552(+)